MGPIHETSGLWSQNSDDKENGAWHELQTPCPMREVLNSAPLIGLLYLYTS